MYVSKLNGAKLVVWKANIQFCPPDCGGKDLDEIEYYPYCPNCDNEFDDCLSIPNFCPKCGVKLWKEYNPPKPKAESEE